MRLRDILDTTEASLLSPTGGEQTILERDVVSGFGADLMSDVLFYDTAQGLLITGLINPQTVRTAEMADIAAILMVRGKMPLPETRELAEKLNIPILGTASTMYETCGRLYKAGLPTAHRQTT